MSLLVVHLVSQDLSVAGNREGLAGERSGLFLEQIRIIKEMRERDKANGRTDYLTRPRFAIWENVEGSLSSNKGKDFQTVLTEFVRIACPDAPDVPMPENNKGRWGKVGCLYDELGRWSIAWRLHDAQYWGPTYYADGRAYKFGTPQRRRRIALVADFGGLCAPEVLLIRKGLSWHPAESREARETAAAPARGSFDETSGTYTLKVRGGAERDCYGKQAGKGALIQNDLSATLGVTQDQTLIQLKAPECKAYNSWDVQSKHILNPDGVAEALYSGDCRWGGSEAYVLDGAQNRKVYSIGSYNSEGMKSSNPEAGIYEAETARTLDNNGANPACYQGGIVVIEGNGSRASHRGPGFSESDVMYTLNTIEQHAVAYNEQVLSADSTKSQVYDARGNGDGTISPTITGDHQNRITDYTAIVVQDNNTGEDTIDIPESGGNS